MINPTSANELIMIFLIISFGTGDILSPSRALSALTVFDPRIESRPLGKRGKNEILADSKKAL